MTGRTELDTTETGGKLRVIYCEVTEETEYVGCL